jgi:ubiquinone/menaquinone biosynthesis C-methylase UbiE
VTRARRDEPDGALAYQLRCLDKLGFSFTGAERLLDVGSGDGRVAALLRDRVAEVVAIDVEADPAWARLERAGLSFRVGNGEALDFPDGSFDVLHSKDSLHHMDDPDAAVREYRRVVRPGGAVLIVEGNRFNPIFYPHMTLLLGHEHFSRTRFRSLVASVFPEARFGQFEAHYVPFFGPRLRVVQHGVEELAERVPLLRRLASYNFAVARL